MTIGVITVIAFIIILGLLFYTKTKNFRESRERKLIYSTEFQNLKRIGFKTKRVDSKTVYNGKFKDY
jgi:UDP-glucose 6-dehydrogenase